MYMYMYMYVCTSYVVHLVSIITPYCKLTIIKLISLVSVYSLSCDYLHVNVHVIESIYFNMLNVLCEYVYIKYNNKSNSQ